MSEHDYLSRYSLQFASQLDELGWRVYDRVVSSVENLEHNPRLGRLYVPQYQASPIPMPCRCLYVHGTTKVLYYTVDECTDAGLLLHWRRKVGSQTQV